MESDSEEIEKCSAGKETRSEWGKLNCTQAVKLFETDSAVGKLLRYGVSSEHVLSSCEHQ